jgi:pimeloyl-ACP methyl ester carboxylesterase
VHSQKTSNGSSVVIAVYTPPTFFNQLKVGNKTIHVVVDDPNNSSFGKMEIPIQIHKLPVVLVHGIWESSKDTWNITNFTRKLESNNFKVYFADYTPHYAETFDPYKIPKIGNYGINSINKTISTIIETYHNKSIADSQVDVVGHSMGGLMARGYTQQSYYKNENNYMKGYIHRLITIGTPHYGAPLSTILHNFSDVEYCFDSSNLSILGFQCPVLLPIIDILDLKTIYNDKYHLPITEGGIDALIPDSKAYSLILNHMQ